MVRFAFAIILTIFISTFYLSSDSLAFSKAEKEELKRGFLVGFTNPKAIERKLDLLGLRGEQRSIASEYLEQLSRNEKYIDYMVDELIKTKFVKDFSEGLIDRQTLAKQAMRFGYELEANLSMRGMLRLSDEDVKDFISILTDVFLSIDPKYCRGLAGFAPTSQMDEINSTFAMLRTMDAKNLRTYYRLNLKAVNAELIDFPSVPLLNDYQIEQANQAYENALLETFIESGSPAYFSAAIDPDSASDYDICRSMAFGMKVAKDMDGVAGEWMRAIFFR